jgi:multiple sugar transport system permease protein
LNARLRARLALWLLAPALLYIAVLGAFPVLSQFFLSFTRYNLKFPDERGFVGLENYARLLGDGVFWADLGQTTFFTVASVSLELIFGLAAALLVNKIVRGRTAMNSSIIVPWALPTVVAATMWSLLLNDRVGLVNSVLERLGLMSEPIVWLGPKLAMISLIAADVWKTTPFVAIILLAGLKSIPSQYYEAAALDGAGRWATFRSITLPLLRPFIAVAVLFRTMDAFRIFDLVWVLTGGASRTETLSVYIQKVLFRYADLGYGSTMTVALFFIVFALSLTLIRFMRVTEEAR